MWISHILLRNNLTIASRIFFFSFFVGFLVYANQLRRGLTVTFYTRSYNLERILVNISVISVHLSEHMTIIIASFFSPCHHFVRWCVFFIVVTCSVVPQRKRINSYNSKQVPHVKNIANQILGFVRETYAT